MKNVYLFNHMYKVHYKDALLGIMANFFGK